MVPEDLHVVVVTRAIAPFHGVGGLERHGRDLVRHLLGRGVRVSLITQPPFSATSAETLEHEPLEVHFVPYWTFPFAGRYGTTVIDRSTAYLWFGWRAGRLAARLVRKGGVHLVHGMGAAVLGYASAREADWYGTVPLLFNPHGMEEFGSTGPGLGAAKDLAYAPLRRAVRRCARTADCVVSTDAALVPVVVSHLQVDRSRVAVVPNAVDLDAIDRVSNASSAQALRQRIGLSPEDILLVGVGRLEANKGFHELITAVASLATKGTNARPALAGQWRLALLGEGSERPRLERDIATMGLGGSVLLPGRVSEAELHAWYEAATLFVHPSLYEGSSIVTLEAMAHRRAVVATMAGGLPDKVRPGVNGWLVPPGDASALAAALATALDTAQLDRRRLTDMGDESRTIVEREFAWEATIGRLLGLYEDVLAGRLGPSRARSPQATTAPETRRGDIG